MRFRWMTISWAEINFTLLSIHASKAVEATSIGQHSLWASNCLPVKVTLDISGSPIEFQYPGWLDRCVTVEEHTIFLKKDVAKKRQSGGMDGHGVKFPNPMSTTSWNWCCRHVDRKRSAWLLSWSVGWLWWGVEVNKIMKEREKDGKREINHFGDLYWQ